ncbi:MAG: hypothetical protein M3680_13815 [Myxococcota bacterium]|nr:hypothetical protein [Myxococcota bacterium]
MRVLGSLVAVWIIACSSGRGLAAPPAAATKLQQDLDGWQPIAISPGFDATRAITTGRH